MADSSEPAEIFTALRGQALSLDHETLGLDRDYEGALALLMETGYKEAVASLVAVCEGTASLYFSTGGGVIGAGEDPAVAELARGVVTEGRQFGAHLRHDPDPQLPAVGEVRFHLVTGAVVLSAAATEQELTGGGHPLSGLFDHCHRLLSAIRIHSERSHGKSIGRG